MHRFGQLKHPLTILAAAWLAWVSVAGLALAEPPPPDRFDLTFRRAGDPDTWLRPTARWDSAFFASVNPWAGNAGESIGRDNSGWGEIGVMPGIDGQLSLGDRGTVNARLSGVFTTTQIGIDSGGTNFDAANNRVDTPDKITLEDAYMSWRSGKVFPSLGHDAVELLVGSKQYVSGPSDDLGQGLIFYKGTNDGGRRGGFWLGMRTAFRLNAIARLKRGPLMAEALYLRANEVGSQTEFAGVNFHYDFDKLLHVKDARLGLGYWNVFAADDARRDGLNVLNVRGDVRPIRPLPGLRLTGEMVKENNGSRNDSWAAWGELGYEFETVSWKPYLSYRFAYFSGDDGTGDNTAFDPLFYGYSDWNYWFLGEISGEFVATNRNLLGSIVRLRATPIESVTTQLFWIYQRLDQLDGQGIVPRPPSGPRLALIGDKDLSHEVNFIVDWSVNDHLLFSFVGAVLEPLKGGRQFFGDDKTWGQFMLYWTVKI